MPNSKNLDEAIMDVVHVMLTSPMRDLPNPGVAVIREFLAQRFALAASQFPECEPMLNKVFEQITAPGPVIPPERPKIRRTTYKPLDWRLEAHAEALHGSVIAFMDWFKEFIGSATIDELDKMCPQYIDINKILNDIAGEG